MPGKHHERSKSPEPHWQCSRTTGQSAFALVRLFSRNAAIVCDNRNIDTSRTYNDYAALHGDTSRVAKAALSLTLKDARLLCSFVVRDGGDSDGLQLLYDAVGVAATGIRGRAADNTASSIKVRVRPHAAETEEAPGATVHCRRVPQCTTDALLFRVYQGERRW